MYLKPYLVKEHLNLLEYIIRSNPKHCTQYSLHILAIMCTFMAYITFYNKTSTKVKHKDLS